MGQAKRTPVAAAPVHGQVFLFIFFLICLFILKSLVT